MRWIAKAVVQRAIGLLPGSEAINYQFQRRVTRSLTASDEQFKLHARETFAHYRVLREHLPEIDPSNCRLYEFGAGWNLTTPILFYGLGLSSQTLIDIEEHLRFEPLNHTIDQYRRLHGALEDLPRASLRPIPDTPVVSTAELEKRFGIRYLAPRDARDSGLSAKSFDFASSTFTLEHIPRADIAAIMIETSRLLRPGGVLSSSVDMQDHYSFFDPSISVYNFLKFSDQTWRLVNSPLHFQNRLRARDYRELCEEAGFTLVDEEVDVPDAERVAQLKALRIAPRFRATYTDEELAPSWIRLVAKKNSKIDA
jgi:SAM-dependent methyltransferase